MVAEAIAGQNLRQPVTGPNVVVRTKWYFNPANFGAVAQVTVEEWL
jgi:hypothetical protein